MAVKEDEEVELIYSLKLSKNKKKLSLSVESNDRITYDDLRYIIDRLENEQETGTSNNQH